MSWVQFQSETLHKKVHVMSIKNKKKIIMKNNYHVIIFIEVLLHFYEHKKVIHFMDSYVAIFLHIVMFYTDRIVIL